MAHVPGGAGSRSAVVAAVATSSIGDIRVALRCGVSAIGNAVVWWVYRVLPESPRWLLQHGQLGAAERLVSTIESRVRRETGSELPAVAPVKIRKRRGRSGFGELFRPRICDAPSCSSP